jgi:2-iminoacetate synthase
MNTPYSQFIDAEKIARILEPHHKPVPSKVNEVLSKAKEMKGLNLEDVAVLTHISDPMQLFDLFEMANHIKEKIYGKRLVIFAPLYISNSYSNEYSYGPFRAAHDSLVRKSLSQSEIVQKTEMLIRQGHKRILMVADETYANEDFQYVIDSIASIYNTHSGNGEIRRVNVNLGPLDIPDLKRLRETRIGSYQLLQETYHPETYQKVLPSGKNADYEYRLTALHRAMEAGIENVGCGVLFGLYDFRFELLALMQHIGELENIFGIGPHTISVPRIEPAAFKNFSGYPLSPVTDLDYRKIIAILRLAVPYTGIIMSTRETPQMRRETLALGVSQISAGSYAPTGKKSFKLKAEEENEYALGDQRPLDEVVRDIAAMGYIPSFCNSCHRLGRTGHDFMDMAKPGSIKEHCNPNALSTFMEYLMDYASYETKLIGEDLIDDVMDTMEGLAHERAFKLLEKVKKGNRDMYC